jgi:hypothetical protein
MAVFFAKVSLFNNENNESFRFEQLSDYYKEIHKLTDLMEAADIVVRIDSLDNQTFDTFWELATKMEYDLKKYASSCILKVKNIKVPTLGEFGDGNVTRNFHGYFVCGDYNSIDGPSEMYLQDFEDYQHGLFKMQKF